jgi:hypothetical protein
MPKVVGQSRFEKNEYKYRLDTKVPAFQSQNSFSNSYKAKRSHAVEIPDSKQV